MLVALEQMQISFVTARGSGLVKFRKNVISFPQDINDMKNLAHFFSTLTANDVVKRDPVAWSGGSHRCI